MTENRSAGKEVIYDDCKAFEVRRIKYSILKQVLWKRDLTLVLDIFQPKHAVASVCPKTDLLVI